MIEQSGRQRIAIFQSDWPLQSQTANCAIMLARAGFEVDLFLHNVPQYFNIQSSPEYQENFRIHFHVFGNPAQDLDCSFPQQSRRSFVEKIISFITRSFRRIETSLGLPPPLIKDSVLKQSADIIKSHDFMLLIGIEKKGLVWAGSMSDRFKIPYVYYSLELYTKDHPDSMVTPLDRQIKASEEFYHQKTTATIVQDVERGRVLFKDNGLAEGGTTFYVPVSLLGSARRNTTSFFQDKYKLPPSQKIILQFGLFYNRRFSLELIETARLFPHTYSLILHGYSLSQSYQRQLEERCHDRVILSQDFVPSEFIQDVIASADIGLVLYTSETKNDLMTAFSSEKLALYLLHGKPIIAFDYPGYRKLVEECNCGVLIHSLSELPQALEIILTDWERYSNNAVKCFALHYDYAKNIMPFIDWLNQNRKTNSPSAHHGLT